MGKLIADVDAFVRTLKRLKAANDNVAFRTSGGLRIMIRNDPTGDECDMCFDVSVIIEDESPTIGKAIKNEIDIVEDDSGCIVIEEYSFAETDTQAINAAVDFLNAVDLWTVCPCGEYLVKDVSLHSHAPPNMCYFCDFTSPPTTQGAALEVFCPICHDAGNPRWMIVTSCCKQPMHIKCREACIASDTIRNQSARCPMCRDPWT